MKKSTKWLIAAAVLAIFFGQYNHVLYSWVGIDVDGYTADMKGKKVAYKLHGAYKQAEVDGCFKKNGVDLDNLNDLLDKIKSGAITATPALKRCIEEKAEGYASPASDVKRIFSSLKDALPHKEKLLKTVTYKPRKYGVGGMRIDLSQYGGDNKYPYRYECFGEYRQFWSGDNSSRYIGCTGFYSGVPEEYVYMMPIENPREYGRFVFDVKDNMAYLNINVPQIQPEYSRIQGALTIKIYN